jgi:spore germination protein YaaH
MKKYFALFAGIFCIGLLIPFGLSRILTQNGSSQSRPKSSTPAVTAAPAKNVKSAVFVPYWSLKQYIKDGIGAAPDGKTPSRQFYFAVTTDASGEVDQTDQGYEQLEAFSKAAAGDKILTVRPHDQDAALALLKNEKARALSIDQVTGLASTMGFHGVALDMEISGLVGSDVPSSITTYTKEFASRAHEKNLTFTFILYGDVYYRHRPYEVKGIAAASDEVLLMAYDFHKARGEAGPNFPFEGGDKYDYDFKRMTDDILKDVPAQKVSVAYGMYGYDWTVDENKKPIKPATSIALAKIKASYIDTCIASNCVLWHDPLSRESEIDYVDKLAQYHLIWFEDERSAAAKTQYLMQQGVGSVAYWSYGYY